MAHVTHIPVNLRKNGLLSLSVSEEDRQLLGTVALRTGLSRSEVFRRLLFVEEAAWQESVRGVVRRKATEWEEVLAASEARAADGRAEYALSVYRTTWKDPRSRR